MNIQRTPLLLILLYLVIGFWFSMAVPPFEAPDEVYHYAFVRHLAQGNGLPIQNANEEGQSNPWKQEGSQAPLYYLIVGRLTAGIDQSDFDQLSHRNERANIGDPLYPGNKNLMLYSSRNWPLQGSNLALHIGRWFSLLLGVVTLWSVWQTARLVWPDQSTSQLASIAVVAALPQFAFISAACSNDSLITAMSSLTVYWLIRLASQRTTQLTSWFILGVLLGLALLSKLQALALIPLVGITLFWILWQRQRWDQLVKLGLAVALPCLLIAGWWYWRNYALYNDWLGTSQLVAINGLRTESVTWSSLWGELRGLRYSFWGLFGWFNILLPNWVYIILDLVLLSSVFGLIIKAFNSRPKNPRSSAFIRVLFSPKNFIQIQLWLWAILCSISLIYWMIQAEGGQGRLLFPGLIAFSILFVQGLDSFGMLLARNRVFVKNSVSRFHALLPLFLVGCSLYTLIVLLPASYGLPRSVQAIPEQAKQVNITYGDEDRLTLLAVDVPPDVTTLEPGKALPITLYLRAEETVEQDYQLFIQLLDEQGQEISNLTTHPGWGRNPTTLWQPGGIYAESYDLLISGEIDNRSPLLATVYTGFVNPATEESGRFPITARDETGAEITPFVERVPVRPRRVPQLDEYDLEPLNVIYGDTIALLGYDLALRPEEDTLEVTLLWQAEVTPATDYTAYVHLLDEDDQRVAGFDQMPATRFPTRYWRVGDRVVSHFSLALPEEEEVQSYAAWVGLYESDSQGAVRLPITLDSGWVVAHNQLLLSHVK